MDCLTQIMGKVCSLALVTCVALFSIVSRSMCQDHCLDHKGQWVPHGERYFPMGTDPCTQCTCINGTPEVCISVFCSPPENCRQYHALNDKCCQFVCLDPPPFNVTEGNKNDSLTVTNLGLRLVASAVTSFLILALLLFMIHRLRQRRLLLVIRRLNGQGLNSNQSNGQHYSMDDEGSVGYFTGHDQLDFGGYDEPPPPYCFWKPPETYIPTGEAPPPYEATEGQNQPNNNNNSTPRLSNVQPGIESPKTEYNQMTQTEPIAGLLDQSGNHVTVLQLRSSNEVSSERLVEEDIRNGNLLPSTSTPMQSQRETADCSKQQQPQNSARDSRSISARDLASVTANRPTRVQVRNTGCHSDGIAYSDANSWVCDDSSSSSTSPTSSTSSEPHSTLSSTSSSATTSPDSDFVSQRTNEMARRLNVIPENVVATAIPKSKIGKTFWHLKQLSHHRIKPKTRKSLSKNAVNVNAGVARLARPNNLNLNSWVVAGIRVHTNPTCNEGIEETAAESTGSCSRQYNLNIEREDAPTSVDNGRRHSSDNLECSLAPTYNVPVLRSISSETGEVKQTQLSNYMQRRQGARYCNGIFVQQSTSNNFISNSTDEKRNN